MPLSLHTRERVVNVMRRGYHDLPPAVRQAAWRGALCFNCFGPRADCGGVATCSRPAYSRASGEIAQPLRHVEGSFREFVSEVNFLTGGAPPRLKRRRDG